MMTQRLAGVCVSYLRQQSHAAGISIAAAAWICKVRTFGTDTKGHDGEDTGLQAPEPPSFSKGSSPFGRRRPLSPLERISQLLPQNSLPQEVRELRADQLEEDEERSGKGSDSIGEDESDADAVIRREEVGELGAGAGLLPGERPLSFGEVLLGEYRRGRRLEFQKMFQLQEGVKLQSSWGVIPHEAFEGRPAGTVLPTSLGFPILVRRPSLEEFTLFMRRGPAIAYPKDVTVMLMMMDVNEGDCVLESGSGSGAMSLFLSRAVGCKGSVLSVEIREDHHRRSVLNYQRWRSSWTLRRREEWPDNVHFHLGDLVSSAPLLCGRSFNSVALDMVSPHLTLPTIVPHLHNGGVCAVYLANVTQIVDLLEGLRCSTLPLTCERIVEVQCREWLLAPSIQKDGSFTRRKCMSGVTTENQEEDSNDEEKEEGKGAPFGSVPYIARPHPEQVGHTAFLVKLRKISK